MPQSADSLSGVGKKLLRVDVDWDLKREKPGGLAGQTRDCIQKRFSQSLVKAGTARPALRGFLVQSRYRQANDGRHRDVQGMPCV